MNEKRSTINLLDRIGDEIEAEANANTAPYRTGKLKRDIQKFAVDPFKMEVEIGATEAVPYAKYVHGGTGVYGKYKTPIVPKRRYGLNGKPRALKTPFGYFKSVKGQKANPYLDNALENYKSSGRLDAAIADYGFDMQKEIIKDIKLVFKKVT
ncbi:MAG: hypothetical protein LBI57_03390 [Helicobacteraceae bacterium]|jgi:hypothetical protein|nr:hypothetical protein [Helicobacteraceae bacterium]